MSEFEQDETQGSLELTAPSTEVPIAEVPLADASLSMPENAVVTPMDEPKPPRLLPHLLHTFVLLVIGFLSLMTTAIAIGIFYYSKSHGKVNIEAIKDQPILIVGFEIVIYLIALAIAWPLFTLWWRRDFLDGVYWNAQALHHWGWKLISLGVVLSLTVEIISNYLPMPKDLPVDQFFKSPASLWVVALFGTFLAPFVEELFFRGFLLPSLANAWEWCANKWFGASARTVDASGQPNWSWAAILFGTLLSSIGFTAMHADQLNSAWAPLAVLFVVSLALTAVRLYFRSLAASVLVHAAYNGTLFVITFFATDGFQHLDKIKG